MSTQEKLLQATARVLTRDGFSALTLEAVAKEAGVSKGGLLYHFPHKNSLISALIQRHIELFELAHQQALKQQPQGPGRWTRAYIQASLQGEDAEQAEISTGLIAAVATDPTLLQPLQERYTQWINQLENDGIPPVDAQLIRLAVDGIWLCNLIGLAPPSAECLAQLETRLQALL